MFKPKETSLLILAGAAIALLAVACGGTPAQPAAVVATPQPVVSATDAMVKPTDAMAKPTDAMVKPTDAMVKPTDAMAKPTDAMVATDAMKFPDNLVTPHFVDSAPMNAEQVKQLPEKVVLNFNFTLHEISEIVIEKDGVALQTPKPTFGDKKLSMSTTLPKGTGDGLYVVKYKACWPDRSCHNGQFAFKVASK